MQIKVILAALDASGLPEHKTLAAQARAEFGALSEVEIADVNSRLAKGDAAVAQVAELGAKVKDLEPKAQGADALKATVTKYEGAERRRIIEKTLTAKAKELGIKPDAVSTVATLGGDWANVKVDLATGEVTGLTKDLIDPMKKSHAIIVDATASAAGTLTPPPPAGASQAAPPKIPGPVGGFMDAIRQA